MSAFTSTDREGRVAGRAKLQITDLLVSIFLQNGISAVRPTTPLHDVAVLDARLNDRTGVVELLLEGRGDELKGPPAATIDDAPVLDYSFQRRAVIDEDAAYELALDLLRIVDAAGPRGGHDDAAPARPEAELALQALKRVPTTHVERARAQRLALGETIPTPDPADVTDEIPGA